MGADTRSASSVTVCTEERGAADLFMDVNEIATLTSLPRDKVVAVVKSLGGDGEVERALSQFFEDRSGPFNDVEGAAWAESGKPRRPKKGEADEAPPPMPGDGGGQKTMAEEMAMAIEMKSRVNTLTYVVGGAVALVVVLVHLDENGRHAGALAELPMAELEEALDLMLVSLGFYSQVLFVLYGKLEPGVEVEVTIAEIGRASCRERV